VSTKDSKQTHRAELLPAYLRDKPAVKSWDSFMGKHRKPQHPDELGAAHVVEPLFSNGERVLFVKVVGTEWYELRKLPARPQ
jgi:hypothetical protein